jgi:hypothetical protein
MITVFFHGCSVCGLLGTYVKQIRQYAKDNNIEFTLKNSKYSEDDRMDHAMHLTSIGENMDFYAPIVVKDDVVILLSKWSI